MRILTLALCVAFSAAPALAQGTGVLEASLRRGVAEPLFTVNQPAYVAVFELIAGLGVEQMFPRSGSQAAQPVQPGEYLLSRPFRSAYHAMALNSNRPFARPVYMIDDFGRVRSYYYSTGWTYEPQMGPMGYESGRSATRTYLLVASRTPLRLVDSPEAAEHWLQRVVGFQSISNAVFTPKEMLTDIVDAVLPLRTQIDDVVVDVLEVEESFLDERRLAGNFVSFYCGGGYYSVSAEYFFSSGTFYCPRQGTQTVTDRTGVPLPSDTSSGKGGATPPDEVKLRGPEGRRPIPERGDITARGRRVATDAFDAMAPRASFIPPDADPEARHRGAGGRGSSGSGAWVPSAPTRTPVETGSRSRQVSPGSVPRAFVPDGNARAYVPGGGSSSGASSAGASRAGQGAQGGQGAGARSAGTAAAAPARTPAPSAPVSKEPPARPVRDP